MNKLYSFFSCYADLNLYLKVYADLPLYGLLIWRKDMSAIVLCSNCRHERKSAERKIIETNLFLSDSAA